MIGVPMSTRCMPSADDPRVALEVVEQLRAALVLVDAADVDREPIAEVELLPEPRRRRSAAGISDPTPTTTPGHVVCCRRRVWISARSSNELYISARTPRNTGPNIDEAQRAVAFGRRHEDRLARRPRERRDTRGSSGS